MINLLVAWGQMNAQTDPAEIYFRTYGYMPVATPLNGEIVYISKAEYFSHHGDLVVVDVNNKPVGLLRVGRHAPEAF